MENVNGVKVLTLCDAFIIIILTNLTNTVKNVYVEVKNATWLFKGKL